MAVVDGLPEFLEGVRAALEAGLGHTVVDGYIEGPLEIEYGCVYPAASGEDEDNVLYENLLLRARIFLPLAQQHVPEQPPDTSDLLALRGKIVDALKVLQTAQLGIWYFRISGFEFSARQRWCEAALAGKQQNPFTYNVP